MYFRCEHILNRLLFLFDKPVLEMDDYVDLNIEKKTIIIKNIIKTLGFDLTNLKNKILREEYYLNVKKLFAESNEFKKDYVNIRILFGKEKHVLNENLKGHQLSKLLNGFLNEFGLNLINKKTCKTINKKNNKSINKNNIKKLEYSTCFVLEIDKKFNNYLK